MIVVADTGPIHYLILCGYVAVLHDLYGVVVLPEAVKNELSHPTAPAEIGAWIAAPPPWVSIRRPDGETGFERLGAGEREALRLAIEMHADFVLIDESLARRLAAENQISVKGTLGILEEASQKLNLNLEAAIQKLRQTGIYLDEKVIAGALERDLERRHK